MKRYYQILELPINASPRRIKEQYRKLAKQYHPDTTANPAEKARFAEKFREINDAYEALALIVSRATLAPHERKLDYLYNQGRVLYDHKKWSRAMVVFNEILTKDPVSPSSINPVIPNPLVSIIGKALERTAKFDTSQPVKSSLISNDSNVTLTPEKY